MATCNEAQKTQLKSACPPDCHAAVDQLAAAGLNFGLILQLIVQYGPQLAAIAQQIIAALTPHAPVQATPSKFACCDCDERYAALNDALCEAICLNCCLAQASCAK